MPTSTIPYEVLFDFTNDTCYAATLQLARGDDGIGSGGAMILLHRQESVSLVLNAGSTYHYTVKQHERKAQISVRTWRDVHCKATELFANNGFHVGTPTPYSTSRPGLTVMPYELS